MRTLLVAGHHGSRYSSSEEFLDALHPGAIVCSCGYDNQFGFPAPAVIERCAERNIPMYRTDLQGRRARRIGRAQMDNYHRIGQEHQCSKGPGRPPRSRPTRDRRTKGRLPRYAGYIAK